VRSGKATNESWMILKDLLARPVREADLGEVLDTIRRQTTLVRGAMEGTMLRNDIFNFAGWAPISNAPTTPRAFST
jgi:uncharacterized alpha-E superfamily protein